VCLTAHDVNPI